MSGFLLPAGCAGDLRDRISSAALKGVAVAITASRACARVAARPHVRKVGRVVLPVVKLALWAELLAFSFVIALGGFAVAIAPEGSSFWKAVSRGFAHGGGVNHLHAITTMRGACVVLVICAAFLCASCGKRIAALLRPFRQWVNLVAAVAFALFMALFDWLALSGGLELRDDGGVLWGALIWSVIAAFFVWDAVRKLRRFLAAA